MDLESSSISIIPIANRPALVERWGEDKVSKFESILLQSKIDRGGNEVRKYYVPRKPKPKPPRPVGADPFSLESDDDESDEDENFACFGFDGEDDSHRLNVEEIDKWDRADHALVVTRPLSGMTQRYTCICSTGVDSFTEELVGFMWVAVHGMNSICLATRIDDLDDECGRRILRSGKNPILSRPFFQKGLIGKVEGFVDRSRLPRRRLRHIMKKPFGVVSLISSTTDVHQETGAIEASSAVEYLKDKLKSGLDFDLDETIQTAISALQHQCNQDFTADDIWVCVVHEGVEMCLPSREVKEHLAKINNPTTKTDEIEANEIEEQVSVAVEDPSADQASQS